jgi:hypothetical protein
VDTSYPPDARQTFPDIISRLFPGVPARSAFAVLGGEVCGVFPCQADGMDFCGLWQTPVLRLRWQGSPDQWTIGIYKASTGQYSENELPASSGLVTGTPEQGIDETFALYAGPPARN